MKQYKVRAFVTEDGKGGNVAGVVLGAENLSTDERQSLAAKLGYSETAFHEVSANGERLSFYTPTKQIDFCGHATVGTFGVLSKTRKDGVYPVKMADKTVQVRIHDGKIALEQHLAYVKEVPNFQDTLASAFSHFNSLHIKDATHVDNGVTFYVIEIESWEHIHKLIPNQDTIQTISKENNLVGFYLYSLQGPNTANSRMFAPYYGIPEESATGMGAGCLMAHLNHRSGINSLVVTQGLAMTPPQPSILEAEITNNQIWVAGKFTID